MTAPPDAQMPMVFRDRVDAGHRLADRLLPWRSAQPVVTGLPRGGIPVAAEVAQVLDAPLDAILVRKLGVPTQPELAMGAIGEDGVRVVNTEVMRSARLSDAELDAAERHERVELERRSARYRGGRPPIDLRDRTVIVVDDGIATGSTAMAACRVARAHGATQIIVAVPVAPARALSDFDDVADDIVCLATPSPFLAVGQFYDDFTPTTDEEVIDLLATTHDEGSP
jgi:putative phosphoribosyl transferase